MRDLLMAVGSQANSARPITATGGGKPPRPETPFEVPGQGQPPPETGSPPGTKIPEGGEEAILIEPNAQENTPDFLSNLLPNWAGFLAPWLAPAGQGLAAGQEGSVSFNLGAGSDAVALSSPTFGWDNSQTQPADKLAHLAELGLGKLQPGIKQMLENGAGLTLKQALQQLRSDFGSLNPEAQNAIKSVVDLVQKAGQGELPPLVQQALAALQGEANANAVKASGQAASPETAKPAVPNGPAPQVASSPVSTTRAVGEPELMTREQANYLNIGRVEVQAKAKEAKPAPVTTPGAPSESAKPAPAAATQLQTQKQAQTQTQGQSVDRSAVVPDPVKTAEAAVKSAVPQDAVKAAAKPGMAVEQVATQATSQATVKIPGQSGEQERLSPNARKPEAKGETKPEAKPEAAKPTDGRPVDGIFQAKGGAMGDRATGETSVEGQARADHGATEEPLTFIKHGEGQIATDTVNRTEKAAAPAPTAPAKTLNQAQSAAVTQQVREAADMMMASNRIGTVKIQLNPAELGEITIKVTQMGPKFDAQIDASREAVRNALVQNQGELARAAESRGLTVGNLDIRSSENSPNSTPSTSSAMQAGTDRHSFGNQGRQDAQQQPMREEYERWGRLADATREETAPGLAPAIYGHASQHVNMVI